MRIHPIIVSIIYGAMLSLQAWTLSELINLKLQVAVNSYKIGLINQSLR